MNWASVHGRITGSSPIRQALAAFSCAAGRRHLARFDRLAPARYQTRILLGLLHQAQGTRFGREHDFRRIRTVADFRRLVPLTTRAELWRDYWQPIYPNLTGATWPSLPSAGLQAAHRLAMGTALALVAHARPRARFQCGTFLCVGEAGPAERDLTGRLPALVRPYAQLADGLKPEQCARLPVSCLVGSVERLLPLVEGVKQAAGKRCLADVWPGLAAVLYTRRSPDAPAARLRQEAEGALLLETVGRSEGPIAVEDPRYGAMRLLFDHGVFFEFVPADRAGERDCPRYGIEDVEPGVPYELVVTSPAGLWACRLGRTVCLERRDPPLVRFLDARPPARRRTDITLPTPGEPALRPQSADNPAGPPESSFRSPWSIPADRG